jgi:hypothetical protein
VIEVRCRLERRLLGGRIIIVGTPNEDLANLKISIEIRRRLIPLVPVRLGMVRSGNEIA